MIRTVFTTILLACLLVGEAWGQNSYRSVTIKKITVNAVSPTNNGKSWDNSFGYYKPDLTCKIWQSGNSGYIWASPFRHDNVDNFTLPVSWTVSDSQTVLFSYPTFDKYVFISLYDYDSTSSEDNMAGFSFKPIENLGKKEIRIFENGCSITVQLYWN